MIPDYTEFFDLQEADARTASRARDDFLAALRGDLERLGLDRARSGPIAERLWSDMSGPRRHYHSAVHVLGIFAEAAGLGLKLGDAERVAVWFHDSVCDPFAPPGTNEQRSAAHLLGAMADTPIDAGLLRRAADAIRWTAHHTRNDVPAEHHLVMDLDLVGLSAPPPTFARQSAALRLEYDHLDDTAYNRGTVEFLRQLLSRRSIYYTPAIAVREAPARRQIEREIERLSKSPPSRTCLP